MASRRICACGCGQTIAGRTDQKYLNATHRKRAERVRNVTSVTGPLSASNRPQKVTATELEKSRLLGARGPGDLHQLIYAAGEALWKADPDSFEDALDALRMIPRRNGRG